MSVYLSEEKKLSYLHLPVYRTVIHFVLLFFLLQGSVVPAHADHEVRFQNLTVTDGLSMGTITGVQKDEVGFIWIATAEGLHRYDGHSFKVFKHIDGQAESLADSYILSIKVVGDKMFIGNDAGSLDILDLNSYTFKNRDPRTLDKAFDYPITHLEYFKGSLLMGTAGGGLWLYDIKNDRFQHVYEEMVNGSVGDMFMHGDHIYLSAENKAFKVDLMQCQELFRTEAEPITAMAMHQEVLVFGTTKGLFDYREGSISKRPLPKRKRRIAFITDLCSEGSVLWAGTHGGLLRMEDGHIDHYVSNTSRPFSLLNNKINNLHMDRSGVLWIGTITGLSRYAAKLQKMGLLQYFDHKGQANNNNVYYIYTGDGSNVWLGTLTGGLVKLDRNNKIVDVFPLIKDGAIESASVRCIYKDSKGNFWVGTRDEGLFLFDESNRRFKWVHGSGEYSLPNSVVRAIYEDSEGRLWIGTQQGISRYSREENRFYNYKAEPLSNANNSTYQITEDPRSHHLIIGSFRGGLQWFDPETGHFQISKNNSADSTSISNNNVMCLQWINNDTLLLGTYGGGLNILDVRTMRASHVTERNGLINNAVYGILYEGNGKVWLSTNNGIVHYDIYNKTFVNFKPIHYLQNKEFNEGAFAVSPSGYFYFGGISGLNYFKPSDIEYDSVAPPLVITEIRGEYRVKDKGRIELSFINSRLELDFMALFYVNPEGVKYRFMLEGFDKDWVAPRTTPSAIYPKLNPGQYTFKVMAEDEFGYWVSGPVSLSVHIVPPIWKQWWFIALLTLLLAGGVYALFRYRTRQIKQSYKLQLVDSELRALRSQMNPHFIFNSLNSIQYFILKKQPREAYTYLSKFASLMRKILQNSRLRYISIKDEAEWLALYLEMEKLRMDNALDFEIDTSAVEDVENSYIPTMLIQPYVENSIIHGLLPLTDRERVLRVQFKLNEDHVECQVYDNGIGREAARILNEKRTRKHESAGMALTKSRLAILSEGKGNFDVKIDDLYENGVATGTRVTILLPLILNADV